MRAGTELAAGSKRVVLRRLLTVDAGGILALLFAVASAAIDASQFVRVWHFLDIAVTCDAFKGCVGGRFQGSRVEARGHSGLAFPGAGAGVVAARAVLGFHRCRR